LDESAGVLVVGIIDYVRKYTWDKLMETWVKSSGLMGGGKGKDPTIISPKQYKARFRDAMMLYFVLMPTKFSLCEYGPDTSIVQQHGEHKSYETITSAAATATTNSARRSVFPTSVNSNSSLLTITAMFQ